MTMAAFTNLAIVEIMIAAEESKERTMDTIAIKLMSDVPVDFKAMEDDTSRFDLPVVKMMALKLNTQLSDVIVKTIYIGIKRVGIRETQCRWIIDMRDSCTAALKLKGNSNLMLGMRSCMLEPC